MVEVMTVAQARADLSSILRRFRADDDAPGVLLGSHRRAEAVILPLRRYESLREPTPAVTLAQLRRLAPILTRLAQANRLGEVQVFGSVARGEQRPGSDVDLLVTPQPGSTLFDVAQFESELEVLLECPVSVVPITALDPDVDAAVLREAVAL